MDIINQLPDRLLFAIPKKGRLHEQCISLLKGADINFHRHNRLDIALVKNLPLALIFLPAADIAKFVGDGNVDLGITGQDMVEECEVSDKIDEIMELGFGHCKLQVQVPIKSGINKVEELVAACALGLADGIVDLVETGETMKVAGLHAISTVLETQAILIRNKNPANPYLVSKITSRLKGVIAAKKYVLLNYNIIRDNLREATKITPGRQAPTISPLDDGNWVEVQSMVVKEEVAEIMDKLEEIGARDIMLFKIDNCRV
ncbi:12428_t:CDS:2 [Rhizophagus irregularis]|nr:12428_t:CDS:2 [Rhizophagus irregularis]